MRKRIQKRKDEEKLKTLLYNGEYDKIPDDFEFMIDEHWNIGHGWSGDRF
ncbi:MAG: hypothetical protein IKR63_04535 [Alloprevotella sp.]|nr:hypothetical protein [Alloprevotella sp.]